MRKAIGSRYDSRVFARDPVVARPLLPARLGKKLRIDAAGPGVSCMESFQKRERDRKKMAKRIEREARRKERAERKKTGPAPDTPAVVQGAPQ